MQKIQRCQQNTSVESQVWNCIYMGSWAQWRSRKWNSRFFSMIIKVAVWSTSWWWYLHQKYSNRYKLLRYFPLLLRLLSLLM